MDNHETRHYVVEVTVCIGTPWLAVADVIHDRLASAEDAELPGIFSVDSCEPVDAPPGVYTVEAN